MNRPSRSFLLLIGEHGAMLLPPQESELGNPVVAATHDEKDSGPIMAALSAAPLYPIILLDDTQGLQFKNEDLPALSFFDKRKLLARRLDQAFPQAQLKTALTQCVHETVLVAADPTGPLGLWQKRLDALPNKSGVVGALAIECADMFDDLVAGPTDGWGLLLLAQDTGGMRQIVTRDGAFVFTRLTQPLPDTMSDGYRSTTLALDIKATRDYLLRYGLTSNAPLRLVAVLPESMHTTMQVTPLDVTSRHIYTPHEAAAKLNLPFAPAPDTQAADLLSLLWVASKSKLVAPLMSPTTLDVLQQFGFRKMGVALATLCTLVAAGVVAYHALDLLTLRSAISIARNETAMIEQELATAKATLAPATEPLGRLRKAAQRKRLFAAKEHQLFSLLPPVAAALGDQARVTRLDWSNATQTLTFSARLNAQESSKNNGSTAQIEVLHQKLRESLPKATIERPSPAFAQAPNAPLSNASENANTPTLPEAQFLIRVQEQP